MTEQTTTQTAAPAERLCRCNCGEVVQGKKSSFRPGHDARVVGLMARDIAQGDLTYTNHILLPALDAPLAVETDIQAKIDDAGNAVAALFSPALATKFDAACHTAWDKAISAQHKAAAKSAKQLAKAAKKVAAEKEAADEVAPSEVREVKGEVKSGRWTYPARQLGGQTWRNTKRDGSGEWIPSSAENFQTV